jgi:long-chain acyl-CoA synthetase
MTTHEPVSLVQLVERRAKSSPQRAALSIWREGAWHELSYAMLDQRVRQLGSLLIENGIERGSHVAILCESRPLWGICFFATAFAGAIAVPLDVRGDRQELQRIADHCEPRAILVSSTLRDRVPEIAGARIIVVDQLEEGGRSHEPRATPDDVALVAYTSGTTGAPKGVMITGATLLYEARSLVSLHGLREDDVFLSVLPLNHLLELTCGLVSVLYAGGEVLYAGTLLPADLVDKMRTKRVTSMIGVPALFRTLRKAIEGAFPMKLVHGVARDIPVRAVRRLLFLGLHRLAGGRVRRLISGGSPLDLDTLKFFERIGSPVYQGYGLTETGPVITVNGPKRNRAGSVGQPLPGTEVMIAADGEILVRGPQVMRGYHKAPELTAEIIDANGWLHTGDLGRLENGFLYVTGRLKDLIVLADGRKVHPEDVEAALANAANVMELCVIGLPSERGEEICAVLVPSETANVADIEREIRQRSATLRDFKRPRYILIRKAELPRTRTLKVRRAELQHWASKELSS